MGVPDASDEHRIEVSLGVNEGSSQERRLSVWHFGAESQLQPVAVVVGKRCQD
jgi:hypothetical protein